MEEEEKLYSGYRCVYRSVDRQRSVLLPDVTFTWDRLARLATVDDAFGSRTFHYNDTTDLSLDYEELDGLVDIDLERKYDTNGRDAGYTIDNIADISRTYEAAGRFEKVKDVSPALDIATYAYASNAYDLIASVTLNGTGFTATNTWDLDLGPYGTIF